MNDKVLKDSDKYFWLKSGMSLRSIRELANALPGVTKSEYHHHVHGQKNDFAIWIGDLFDEPSLADMLTQTKSKEEFQTKLYNYVIQQELQKRKEKRSRKHHAQLKRKDHHIIQKNDTTDAQKFNKYHEKKSDEYDKIADRFDEIAHNFEESLHPEMPESVEKKLDRLQEQYTELHQKIVEARKAGKDPLIAALTLRTIPSKIAYARVSHDPKDFAQIDLILKETERELKDAIAFEEPNVKKEVEELVKA